MKEFSPSIANLFYIVPPERKIRGTIFWFVNKKTPCAYLEFYRIRWWRKKYDQWRFTRQQMPLNTCDYCGLMCARVKHRMMNPTCKCSSSSSDWWWIAWRIESSTNLCTSASAN